MLFTQLMFDLFDHCGKVMSSNFCERKVPIATRISIDIILRMTLAMTGPSVVSKPHVITSFPESDRHWHTAFSILMEPRISGHVKTMLQENCLLNMSSILFMRFNEFRFVDQLFIHCL